VSKISVQENKTTLIEAILYLEAEPIDEEKICKISGFSKEELDAALENISKRYLDNECALELSRNGSAVSITVKREYWENLKDHYGKKNEAKISRAAMETLAIVAYSQPVTRAEIEKIRGVSADNMIRLLLEKELIRKAGKKDIPGQPITYGTTKEFLKIFGLGSIADLPKLSEADIEKFELEGDKY